jgi:Mlc titration factor MtfA (ptsG expression regulator)
MFGFRKKRRKRLMKEKLPVKWITILEQNVPYYLCLSPEDQGKLQGLIQVFLDEKNFEGCRGLEMTDEIRLTIAAQACILLLGRQTDIYLTIRSILVYPDEYQARVNEELPEGTVIEGSEPCIGEAWSHGYVVLSWVDVLEDAADIHSGRNIVFHEFAHQLDNEWEAAEGAPVLPESLMYANWEGVLSREYTALLNSIARNRPTLLDEYAAISPAEFFAVATEFYFEKPTELKRRHPELFKQLKLFYGWDPSLLSGKTGLKRIKTKHCKT